jgi:hypothetical protein
MYLRMALNWRVAASARCAFGQIILAQCGSLRFEFLAQLASIGLVLGPKFANLLLQRHLAADARRDFGEKRVAQFRGLGIELAPQRARPLLKSFISEDGVGRPFQFNILLAGDSLIE